MRTDGIRVFRFDAMGTECVLHLASESTDHAQDIASKIIDEVDRIEARYSRYVSGNVLSGINWAGESGRSIEVDEETSTLLDYAFTAYRISEGLFDITSGAFRSVWNFDSGCCPSHEQLAGVLPFIGLNKLRWEKPVLNFTKSGMQLDFGGIGKEYAVDRATQVCRELNVVCGLIDFGGDIRVLGPHPDGTPWNVAIRDPRQTDIAAKFISLSSGALATSGDYERFMVVDGKRYCHIINPTTGIPVSTWQSISIQAEQCLYAGTIASIAMLKEVAAIPWLQTLNIDYYCIDHQGQHFTNMLATDKHQPS